MHTMRGREGKGKGGAPPTDLLVCFPSRTRLALMPKPVSSPSRLMDSIKRRNHRHHHHHPHNQLVRSSNRGGQGSPIVWAKTKSMESDMDEPTSPKVTCAGQIKVKSKPDSCKNWQSVMEEIERLHHHNRKHKKKKPTWVEALGLKKDITQFLSCLRGIKLDLRCFGSFHASVVSSDDDDEEEDDEEKEYQNHEQEQHHVECADGGSGSSQTVFSKWFMVLEENQDQGYMKDGQYKEEGEDDEGSLSCVPPPNALLLMRCRSAPAKTWMEEKQLQEQQEEAKRAEMALDEKKNKESLILKYYAPDFFKVSCDIAKETWVVGGTRDQLLRSRSWKR